MVTRLLLALALLVGHAQSAQAADLYVNNSGTPTCSDATVKASNSAAAPWCTIGRAVWGNASRSSPSSGEAAAAGDTVYVTGGTYDYAGVIDARFEAVYNFTNAGSSGNYITVVCIGDCTLTAADTSSPIVGGNKAYVKWFADVTLGHSWIVVACGEEVDGVDDCPAGTVSVRPDTGPITAGAQSVWIEGFTVTGYAPSVVNPGSPDNWPAVRLEGCDDCVIRNNTISGFTLADYPYNPHAVCFNLYTARDSIIEHNICSDSSGGVSLKDCPSCAANQSGNIVRFNKFINIYATVMGVNHTSGGTGTEGRNYFYQNLTIGYGAPAGAGRCFGMVGGTDDWFFNNTCYGAGAEDSGFHLRAGNASGIKIWNNIIHTADRGIDVSDGGGVMPADTVIDLEHNVYYSFLDQFYWGSDGERSFASYTGAFSDQDQANSPTGTVSIEGSNPLFANIAGLDFRLCTAAGVPHASCSGASPAINRGVDLYDLDGDASTTDAINAGAYITGNEVIGLEVAEAATPRLRLRIRGDELAMLMLLPLIVGYVQRRGRR